MLNFITDTDHTACLLPPGGRRCHISHLFFSLDVEFVTADQFQHLLCPQAEELIRHRDLHKVLLHEAVGRVVQGCAHHGLGKLTYAQTVLGV